MVAHQAAPFREYALSFLPQGVTPQNIAPESYIRVTGKKRNNHQIKSIRWLHKFSLLAPYGKYREQLWRI